MKFTSLTEHFKNSMVMAERVCGKSLNLPILNHCLLQTENNKISLSATNLESALITSFPGKIEETGAITVPAHALVEFLSHLRDEKVDAVSTESVLRLIAGMYRTSFQGLNPEEFPLIPKVQGTNTFSLANEILKTALTQVLNAASVGDIRPELAGILVRREPEGIIKFAATDSFRLAEKSIRTDEISDLNKFSAVVPLRVAQEVLRIAQERNGEVKVISDANQILFLWEDTQFISRLVEGEFPPYESIVPKKFLTEIRVSKKKFAEALRVGGVFSSKINDVNVSFGASGKVILRSANAAIGENEATLEAEVKGEAGAVSFNYRFLIDGLENIPHENIFFGVNNDTAPALLKSEEDPSYFYLLMPIRL